MTPQQEHPSMLIAAHEPGQGKALTEMIRKLRPGVAISLFDDPAPPTAPMLAIVLGASGEGLAEQCARVRSRYPRVSLVVIAPRIDEETISSLARAGASAFVASPCEPGTLLRVLKAEERKVRFAGRCGHIDTSELLRLHAAASSTGVLHFLKGEGEGEGEGERHGSVHLEEGQPVDAQCGEHRGADAVREMLAWSDASASWIAGRSASARTILGRLEGLLERDYGELDDLPVVREAPPDVLAKLTKLAGTEDILGAYLMRDAEILVGHNDSSLDEVIIGRALSRLALVFQDMEELQGDGAGTEIQATVGIHRLVVDRIGPTRLGFQVGVVVRQATPVCKSLRRLLRQMDRSFRRSLNERTRAQTRGSSGGHGGPTQVTREADTLHRVA